MLMTTFVVIRAVHFPEALAMISNSHLEELMATCGSLIGVQLSGALAMCRLTFVSSTITILHMLSV